MGTESGRGRKEARQAERDGRAQGRSVGEAGWVGKAVGCGELEFASGLAAGHSEGSGKQKAEVLVC